MPQMTEVYSSIKMQHLIKQETHLCEKVPYPIKKGGASNQVDGASNQKCCASNEVDGASNIKGGTSVEKDFASNQEYGSFKHKVGVYIIKKMAHIFKEIVHLFKQGAFNQNNGDNTGDPISTAEDNGNMFMTEQKDDLSFRKCFEKVTKCDFHKAKMENLNFT